MTDQYFLYSEDRKWEGKTRLSLRSHSAQNSEKNIQFLCKITAWLTS